MSSSPVAPDTTVTPTVRALLALALPMVLARATQSVISFADALQVKDLGESALAATATGGLNTFALAILPMGTVFIVQSFVAQRVGRGERAMTPRYAWYGLAIAAIAGVLSLMAIPAVRPVLSQLGFAPEVSSQMGSYMTIRLLSVAAIVGTEALGMWYGGLGNTWMQMVAGVLAMLANIFLNWVFISGHLGAPALGVEGAAIASSLASWIGFGFVALAFARGWGGAPKRESPRGLSFHELRRVVRFGLPNGINWFFEFAAFQVFVNVVMADLGTSAVAALNVVLAICSLSFMPAFGLSSAGAILAGQLIGQGRKALVWPQLKLTMISTALWTGAMGLVYLFAGGPLITLFASNPDEAPRLIALGTNMLIISAAWQLADAAGMTLSETLRAAGDTTWTAWVRLLLAWFVFTPAAYIAVNVLGYGALVAFACLGVYSAMLAVALAWRFRGGAWKNIELIEPELI